MAKKDKFAQMRQGGGVGSFQETLVQAATTVAAIERQQEEQSRQQAQPTATGTTAPVGSQDADKNAQPSPPPTINPQEQPRFMRLPNPQIPLQEYNLVSSYCNSFGNMTRQDFVELAIIEKLHNDGNLSQEDFNARYTEIRNRPPRGQRKGTKQTSK